MRWLAVLAGLALAACGQQAASAPADASPPDPVASPQDSLSPLSARKPRATRFVRASADTRTPDQLADDACTGPKREWLCSNRKKPVAFAAAGGAQTPVFPPAWTIPDVYIDPADSSGHASDGNSCTTVNDPCLTWGEVQVHRWGCLGSPRSCPRQRQNTTRHWMSSQSGNTDPVYDFPAIEDGALVSHTAVLPAAAQSVCGAGATLTGVVNLSRTASPFLTQAKVLKADSSECVLSAHLLLVNAAHPSRAWSYAVQSGNTWKWSTPSLRSPFQTDVTWSNGDAVTVYAPPMVDLVALGATMADFDGSFDAPFVVSSVGILDPSGVGNDPVYAGPYVNMTDVTSQRTVVAEDVQAYGLKEFFNVDMQGGIEASGGSVYGGTFAYAGVIGQVGGALPSYSGSMITIDADAIVNGRTAVANNVMDDSIDLEGVRLGTIFLDTGAVLTAMGSGVCWSTTNVSHQAVLYGPGTIEFLGSTRWTYQQGAGQAVATFKETGGFRIGQTPSNVAIFIPTNATPWAGNVANTPTALDGALGTTEGCATATGQWLCNTSLTF